jgi:hypothetical protein
MVKFVNELVNMYKKYSIRDSKEKDMSKDDGSIEVKCGKKFENSYI